MNMKKELGGLWTALITPFAKGDGFSNAVDYDALERVLEMQIEGGVDGVLLLGTTAERPTLTEEEELELIHFCIKVIAERIKIMVNAGTYATLDTVKTINYLDNIEGIDCYLLVNPYYNKPTQTGLKQHFIVSAGQTDRPVFLYNIPCRTHVNLELDSLLEIIEKCPNVVGIKEASGDLNQMKEFISKTPDDFVVLSGEEPLTYDLIQAGGDGVVSVASNCIPDQMKEFIDLGLTGREKFQRLQQKYLPFFQSLFIQTNPLPAKTYLASKGIIEEEFRLPLCRMDKKERGECLEVLERYGW